MDDVTHDVSTNADHKEKVSMPIRVVFNTYITHRGLYLYVCKCIKEKVEATCSTAHPNCYQLPCINKSLYKGSDDSAPLNTLRILLRLCRKTGHMGRRGRLWGDIGIKTREGKGTRKGCHGRKEVS